MIGIPKMRSFDKCDGIIKAFIWVRSLENCWSFGNGKTQGKLVEAIGVGQNVISRNCMHYLETGNEGRMPATSTWKSIIEDWYLELITWNTKYECHSCSTASLGYWYSSFKLNCLKPTPLYRSVCSLTCKWHLFR